MAAEGKLFTSSSVFFAASIKRLSCFLLLFFFYPNSSLIINFFLFFIMWKPDADCSNSNVVRCFWQFSQVHPDSVCKGVAHYNEITNMSVWIYFTLVLVCLYNIKISPSVSPSDDALSYLNS